MLYDGQEIEIDMQWSSRDCTGAIGLSLPDGINVYGSCFSQPEPDMDVFGTAKGITFYNCNLDNVLIPPGCVMVGGSNIRYKVQNDMRDWQVDAQDRPIKVLNEKYWQQQGVSVDPADIDGVVAELPEVKS